jgi:hypothetical protein
VKKERFSALAVPQRWDVDLRLEWQSHQIPYFIGKLVWDKITLNDPTSKMKLVV